MAYFLLIESAAAHTQVILANESGVVAQQLHESPNEQAQVLNVMVASLLETQQITWAQIGAIGVNGGPGSYTGLRVGIGVAKGYCFSMDIPLMMFNRLSLLLAGRENSLLVLKARQGEGFAMGENLGIETLAAQHIFYESFDWNAYQNMNLITDDDSLLKVYHNASQLESPVIDAAFWATAAQKRIHTKSFDDLVYAEPFYLKSAFVTTPKKKF